MNFATNRSRHLLELGAKILLSYMVGSISGALIVGYFRGGVDIRTQGSGNAGGTNALRTQGIGFALFVVLIDIAKGAVPVVAFPEMNLPGIGIDPAISRAWLAAACAGAAVVGHVWPMWFDFAGGKGAATLVGALLILAPTVLAVVLTVWLIVVALTGFVGLASITAAASAPVYLLFDQDLFSAPLMTFACFMVLFIVFTHRSNIRRMVQGKENRMRKLMLFKRG